MTSSEFSSVEGVGVGDVWWFTWDPSLLISAGLGWSSQTGRDSKSVDVENDAI